MKYKLTVSGKGAVYSALSFVIPLSILLCCMFILKLAPFGEQSLLLIDSSSQYVNYLGYFRSVLTGDSDLLYTFSKNLGGDLLSLAAYYMLSPFNLLLIFADARNLPLVFTLIIVLKLSACGLTYYCATARFFGHRLTSLAFSTAYALMGYTVIYEWNIMWLDGVMVLPLMFLGLYRLVQENKIGLYALTIAYALITSFYTGYMLCAAAVLFFLALMAVFPRRGTALLSAGGRFAYASCMGGFAGAPVWLPAVMTLGGNRAALSGDPMAFSWKTDLTAFCAKFIPGAANTAEIYEGMPHVFCGTLVAVLVLLFFRNASIPRRIRLTALGVIALFLASFCLSPLDVAWHGFSPNRLFNFRYSFLFSFVLILTAQYCLSVGGFSRKSVIVSSGIVAAAAVLGLVRCPELAMPGIGVTFFVLLSAGLLGHVRIGTRTMAAVLTLITVLEMGINCGLTWKKMCDGTIQLNYMDYYYFTDFAEPAISEAKQLEDGFYRIEKTFQKDQNDAMLFSYNGLSHFSSTEQAYLMRFQEKMGLRSYFDIWSAYLQGSTADVDALLGVRYLLSTEDQTALKGYELVSSPNGIGIYRNPNALPLAVLSDPAIMRVDMEQGDHFALHNAIWSGLTGEDRQILLREDTVDVSIHNLSDAPQPDGTHLYTRIDPQQEASLRFEITISQELPLYCYFTAPIEEQPVRLLINGIDNGAYFDAFRWNMVNTGTYSPGDKLVIELVPGGESFVFGEGWFCYEDRDALARAAEQVNGQPVFLTQLSGSRFQGSFHCDRPQTLFFTIPWDPGWELMLDGVSLSFDRALDTFLCVQVQPGSHTFSIRFLPTGLLPGAAAAGLSAVMALLWYWIHRKKKKI